MIRKDWKSPRFWLCNALLFVWAIFLGLASGLCFYPAVTNIWYAFLALLTLLIIHFCGKKLDPPFAVFDLAIVTIGVYLVCTFLPRLVNRG